LNRVALILATWFGCGYSPWGPGTVGSLAAILISVLLRRFFFTHASPLLELLLCLALLLPAVWAADRTAKLIGNKDPGIVVIDEVLGQWVTLFTATRMSLKAVLLAFLLFRAFDIWKPWPVRALERLPGGFGIVADDIGAGLYGTLILYITGMLNIY
jgi:phosphatidylglycerophosphatase A